MQIDSKALLCRYRYDALNRLVANTPLAQADSQRFYLKDRLTTEVQGAEQRSIMQHDDQLLAQQQRQSGTVETRLLATDQQRSVLNVLAAVRRNPLAYTPYGHRPSQSGLLSLLGFNGERPDPVTGCYLLGNGYRAFNPVLMRFNSPDSWSPFGEGGLNAYAYCVEDPINFVDPTGHMFGLKSFFGVRNTTIPTTAKPPVPHGKMTNVTRLAEDAYTFETTHKGGSRLTIMAHGSEPSPGNIIVDERLWNAGTILKNIDVKPYDRVRILACHSDTIGAEIALRTGKEVKAYIGKVYVDIPHDTAENFYNLYRSDPKQLSKIEQSAAIIRKQKLQGEEFNYQPVKFTP
ncbi:RHS repeat-associated core domain-containing protein [Pseudomonas sp. RIT-PI-q]|uniref:RHS repeat-associated core domain-containing protein n=1 Tax=Pseudomonas sp. RIT-PI-q TaxID=1690247 RepID=UPI0009EB5DE0|nr:RHS repeat-associated core domain-containing protein [Pseudomonas sp. RIT-PI-q]